VHRDRAEIDARWDEVGPERTEAQKQQRLARTLVELRNVLTDAEMVTAEGREGFDADRRLQLAGEAVVGHLGEVVPRLPASYLDQHPEIPWRQIKGMRNRIVHAYQHTSVAIVWAALSSDIPDLVMTLDLTEQ
jgi:uncharacterized protein with HEPN domain